MTKYTLYTDQELYVQIKENDELAFKELYKRYWYPLLKQAVKLLPTDIYAKEVVQDLFIKVWQTRHSAEIENISHYLYAGIRHGCISTHRILLSKQKYWDYYKVCIPQEERSVEVDYINQEKYSELDRRIARLPSMAQKIVTMKVKEAMTLHDISTQLNCSKKTIEYHLAKSLKLLKSGFNQF